jgi:hypothetical protein
MSARYAQLSIGQIRLGASNTSAVPESHQLGLWIDACGPAYSRNSVSEVIGFQAR